MKKNNNENMRKIKSKLSSFVKNCPFVSTLIIVTIITMVALTFLDLSKVTIISNESYEITTDNTTENENYLY